MLSILCPHCDQQLQIAERAAEHRTRCPHCRGRLEPRAASAEAETAQTVRFTAAEVSAHVQGPIGHTEPAEGERPVAPLAYLATFSAVPVVIIPFLFPLPLVLGILALRWIARNPGYRGTERAVFGIVWGVLGGLFSCLAASVLLFN